MNTLSNIGVELRSARKLRFPGDDLSAFALRVGISRSTLQRMEQGDLSVSLGKYLAAAKLLGTDRAFNILFALERDPFDD